MKQPHLCFAIAGLCFGVVPWGLGQPAVRDSTVQSNASGATDSTVAKAPKPLATSSRQNFLQGLKLSGGQLTVPFKIRNKAVHNTFRLTTDVTLGAYVGVTKKFSDQKDHYITIPLTAGLTFININNKNTTADFNAADDGATNVVPGLTWSSGVIIQLEQYNLGLIFGKDYASEVGNQWNYHQKWWWSFGLGFSFTQ